MDYTPNLELIKPAKAEQYNIEYHNKNSDIIDAAFKDEVDTRIAADAALQEQIDENRHEEKRIGTVPIEKGGTGETTAQEALNALHGEVQTESDIGADDEITFLRRTAADPETETPASIKLKDVKLNDLAAKVYELIRGDSAVFTATKNGLVPKAGSAGSAAFLSAHGTWDIPGFVESIDEIKTSKTVTYQDNTVVKLTAESQIQIILEDSPKFGTMLHIMNMTGITHILFANSVSTKSSCSILPNADFFIMWNGEKWKAVYSKSVGETYEQKPQTDSPFDIFPCSDWTEIISHNGAFYRSANAPTTLYTLEGEKFYRDAELTHPVDFSGIMVDDGSGGYKAGTATDSGSTTTNSRGQTVKIYTGDWTVGNADDFIEKSGDLVRQSLSEVEVGSFISFEGDKVPSGCLLADRSTFDTKKYPALYTELGTNVLPEVFDHNQPGEWEVIDDFTSGTEYVIEYDMDIKIRRSSAVSVYPSSTTITINGVQTDYWAINDNDNATEGYTVDVSVKKGDVFVMNIKRGSIQQTLAKKYTKHMAIKADSGMKEGKATSKNDFANLTVRVWKRVA